MDKYEAEQNIALQLRHTTPFEWLDLQYDIEFPELNPGTQAGRFMAELGGEAKYAAETLATTDYDVKKGFGAAYLHHQYTESQIEVVEYLARDVCFQLRLREDTEDPLEQFIQFVDIAREHIAQNAEQGYLSGGSSPEAQLEVANEFADLLQEEAALHIDYPLPV